MTDSTNHSSLPLSGTHINIHTTRVHSQYDNNTSFLCSERTLIILIIRSLADHYCAFIILL